MLPIVIVKYIISYLPFYYRINPIKRSWVHLELRKRIVVRQWRSKVLLYAYLNTFGTSFTQTSWHRFCICMLKTRRRTRNLYGRLTWHAAADHFFAARCHGCGVTTKASVFGHRICGKCRFNRKLSHCYMVSVSTAVAMGVPRRILNTMPWHGTARGHRLRFWKDIKPFLVEP